MLALSSLVRSGAMDAADAQVLSETYVLLTRLRNGLWLLTGQGLDVLADPAHRRALARRFGYTDARSERSEDLMWADTRSRMRAVRRIFDQRFYGDS
jgi:UTP:GlnB (protein PII) uridylyltransferase